MSDKLRNKFSLLESDSDSNSDNDNNNKNVKMQNNTELNKKIKNNKSNISNKSNTNNNTNKLEEDVINQYYGKKVINKSKISYNNYNNKLTNDINFEKNTKQNVEIFTENNQNDFIKVVSKKKENKIIMECKFKEVDNDISKIQMPNYFRVFGHHNNDTSWDYNSYHKITELHKWGDLVSFFNSLNKASGECFYTDFDIFLMKNDISPMWEDNENRNGSICSIKIDSLVDGYEIFKNLTYNIANNTLLKFNPNTWNSINGISYSSKKLENLNETYCVIIKVWFKINILNYTSVDKILNDDINQLIGKYSIKNFAIKPEF